jgi:hypothetical protein
MVTRESNRWQRTRRYLVLAVAAAADILVSTTLIGSEPYQFRDPKAFWLDKTVFQKRGVVVEDQDLIIREQYWVLDRTVQGQVIEVEQGDAKVWLIVQFEGGMGGGWERKGINVRDRTIVRTQRTVTIRNDPYGDGGHVHVDEVSLAHRIEGDQIDSDRCGVIIRQEGRITVVRFPASLVSLTSPRVGEAVRRSWDWHDGLADGGTRPTGIETCSGCTGTVTKERDEKGFVDVRWNVTGRNKSHRFDHLGYYDVEPVDPQ